MGLVHKVCLDCGKQRKIGRTHKRCKRCRRKRQSVRHEATHQQSDIEGIKRWEEVIHSGEVDGDSYAERNATLLELGFLSYGDYLNSKLWSSIKTAAYCLHGRDCLICKKPAVCIHHLDYSLDTLKGLSINSLVPICEECHTRVEFDGDRKRPVYEARQITLSLLKGESISRR